MPMQPLNDLLSDIKELINSAKENAIKSVDYTRTLLYWHIGKRIFEEEQESKERAVYGETLIKFLSGKLQPEFGSGFSFRQINHYRQFYRTFPIVSTLWTQLSWTQYKMLLSVDDKEKRERRCFSINKEDFKGYHPWLREGAMCID